VPTRQIYAGFATLVSIIAVVVAVLSTGSSRAAAPPSRRLPARPSGHRLPVSASAPAVTATNTLGLAMLARLNPGANAVFSPFSVETAMAMVDQGAGIPAAQQLDRALGGASSPAALATANHALDASLYDAVTGHGGGGPTLNDANGIWLQTGATLQDPFSQTLSADFGAEPQQVDFRDDPSGAIASINRWVSDHTNGLIPSLADSSSVSAATELFLANAVYLHADWADPFDPNRTAPAAFRTTGGSVQTPFMTNVAPDPYAHTSRYTAVALDYAHSSLQYVAIMPPAGQITGLEKWLSVSRLSTLMSTLRRTSLQLDMPKYSLSLDTTLNPFLEGLGMTDIFGANSLTKMVIGQPLQVSDVVHDAVLKVAERGTIAAAATGVGITTSAVAADPVVVDLNHPFLVIIRDTQTGAMLFGARVMNPATAGS
jgi:serpin B